MAVGRKKRLPRAPAGWLAKRGRGPYICRGFGRISDETAAGQVGTHDHLRRPQERLREEVRPRRGAALQGDRPAQQALRALGRRPSSASPGAEAEAYAKSVVLADFEEAGDADVLRKVRGDLEAGGQDRRRARPQPRTWASLMAAPSRRSGRPVGARHVRRVAGPSCRPPSRRKAWSLSRLVRDPGSGRRRGPGARRLRRGRARHAAWRDRPRRDDPGDPPRSRRPASRRSPASRSAISPPPRGSSIAGASAIIAPMINTLEDARRFGAFIKIPAGRRAQLGPARGAHLVGAGARLFRQGQRVHASPSPWSETREAFAILDEILAVPGDRRHLHRSRRPVDRALRWGRRRSRQPRGRRGSRPGGCTRKAGGQDRRRLRPQRGARRRAHRQRLFLLRRRERHRPAQAGAQAALKAARP